MFCLPPELANAFKKSLSNREIDPIKMAEMTTVERRAYLEKYVGKENATQVNQLFETKLLLNNQKQGFVTWAKQITGIKESARRDIVSRIERLDKALNPAERVQFVNDLVDQRLGIHITPEEARVITDYTAAMDGMYQKVAKSGMTRNEIRAELPTEYWLKYRQLENYLNKQTPVAWKATSAVTEVAAMAKTLRATFDISYTLRQAAPYFGRKEYFTAVGRMTKYFKSDAAVDDLAASIMGHKYGQEALNRKRLLGLTIFGEKMTQREEAYLSTLAMKIPVLGKGVKISERTVVGFINDLRANRFLNTVSAYERMGKPLSGKQMDQLAQTIAAGTGRGTLGALESAAKPLGLALFSARFFAGRLITLVKPFQPWGLSWVARIEAAKNLGTVIGLSAGMLGLAKATGGDIETDTDSSDFGKAKFGNVRFDMTAGYGQFVRLFSQIFHQKVKSTTTGKISEIGTGEWGSKDTWDLATAFIENKTGPLFSVLKEMIKGETFAGEEMNLDGPTLLYIAKSLTLPLIIDQTYEAWKESGGNISLTAATTLAEFMGIGVNAYGYKPTTKEWNKLKTEQGQGAYDRAVLELNNVLATKLPDLQDTTAYKSYDISEQNKMVDALIKTEGSKILDKYDIKMKAPTSKTEGVKLMKAVERGELGDWSDDGSFIDDVVLYARAIGTDPLTAFQRIISKQKIRRIDNGAIIVYRIPESASAKVKRELGAGEDEILDHTIPLVLGGSNSRSNLQLVPKSKWNSWTPVEIKLGEMLRAGKITKKEAQKRIVDFKNGKITKSQALR